MDFDDYERLPSTSVATNMMAGATAGVLEHCIMYPMDSVKTRMQSMSPISAGQTIVSTYRNMVLKEGYLRPIRGMGAVVAGAGPAHALYFATYEYTKEQTMRLFPQHHELNYITSSVMATLIHDAISTPTEVIKQRLQMYNSPFKTIVQCTKGVYQSEGLRAFYRSYNTQLIMNLPYQAIHFSTYEFMQNMLNRDHKYNPPVHMVAGAMGGALASAFTTPLDVIKTLLNTQETGIGITKGMREAVKQIYTMAGPLGFFKGMQARVLYAMPATAICWSTYEFAKFILSRETREQYHSSPKLPTIPKDVLSSAAEKVRLDDTLGGLSYVLPRTSAGSPDDDDQTDGGSSTEQPGDDQHQRHRGDAGIRHARSAESSGTSSGSLLSRELPSMSGAGVYSSGLSLNTMHTDSGASRRPGMPFEGRGCST